LQPPLILVGDGAQEESSQGEEVFDKQKNDEVFKARLTGLYKDVEDAWQAFLHLEKLRHEHLELMAQDIVIALWEKIVSELSKLEFRVETQISVSVLDVFDNSAFANSTQRLRWADHLIMPLRKMVVELWTSKPPIAGLPMEWHGDTDEKVFCVILFNGCSVDDMENGE